MSATPRRPAHRPVNGIDLAASALARLAPRRLTPAIEQVRRDARALTDGFTGQRERSYRSERHPARPPRPLADIDPLEELLPRGLGARYATLKRDVLVVARSLRGEHPAPLVARERSVRAPVKAASGARVLRVAHVTRETDDAVTLELEDPSDAAIRFEAGQFLSVRAEVNGETLWRAYSLSSAPASGKLAITIKRVEGGRVSNHLNANTRAGDMLEVRGPSGRFTLAASPTARHVVLIGGGSGITPLMAHARHLLTSEPRAEVTLLYGNRSARDVIFRDALEALRTAHASRFRVRHVLEQASDELACAVGRLDQATSVRELRALSLPADATYLVCGPEPMMDGVRAALGELGVPRARILEERFVAPRAPVAMASGQTELVTLRVRGAQSEVRVGAGQTILDAALAQGVPLDFSCTMGGCGACMVQLREGQVHMDEPNCLSERERAAGSVLACIAHPQGPCVLEKD